MLKRLSRTMATIAALSALVMVSQAGAADKLVVKGTDGTTTVFKVEDTGKVSTITTLAETGYLVESTNNGVVRTGLRGDGVQYWQMKAGTAEAGQIMYSTPGGGAGIVLYNAEAGVGWKNRFDWINYGTYASMGFNGINPTTLNITKTDKIGIGVLAPTQKLEVNGGVRLNTATAQPSCDSNARGTIWYTSATDKLEICTSAGWKQISTL